MNETRTSDNFHQYRPINRLPPELFLTLHSIQPSHNASATKTATSLTFIRPSSNQIQSQEHYASS